MIDAMGKLRLYGMRAAYDEVLTTAVKRQHELDLSRFDAAPSSHLGSLSFEDQGAFPSQC